MQNKLPQSSPCLLNSKNKDFSTEQRSIKPGFRSHAKSTLYHWATSKANNQLEFFKTNVHFQYCFLKLFISYSMSLIFLIVLHTGALTALCKMVQHIIEVEKMFQLKRYLDFYSNSEIKLKSFTQRWHQPFVPLVLEFVSFIVYQILCIVLNR